MASTAWKGDSFDDRPKFGRKARAWFARQIDKEITRLFDESWHDEDGRARLVDWYLSDVKRFVVWVDSDQYHGSRFSNGAWQINRKAVKAASDQAVKECNERLWAEWRAKDFQRFPTLDAWLRADIDDDLSYSGAEGGMQKVREWQQRHDSETPGAAAPRGSNCCPCGKLFARRSGNHRYCDGCKASQRESYRRAGHASALRSRQPGTRGVFRGFVGSGRVTLHALDEHDREVAQLDAPAGGHRYREAIASLWQTLDQGAK